MSRSMKSNALRRSIKAVNTFALFRIKLFKGKMWSSHDLFDLKPFCSSANKLLSFKYPDKRLLMKALYTLFTHESKLIRYGIIR